MAKSLDDTLRGLAKRGELTYLSILSNGDGFRATYSPATHWGHGFGEDPTDPVGAIQSAIKNFRKPGRADADIETNSEDDYVDPEVAEMLS